MIVLMSRVLANGPGDQGLIPGQVIPKNQKLYLMLPCLTLSIIRSVSSVEWINAGNGVTPSPTPRWSIYWKGSFRVANFTYSNCRKSPQVLKAILLQIRHGKSLVACCWSFKMHQMQVHNPTASVNSKSSNPYLIFLHFKPASLVYAQTHDVTSILCIRPTENFLYAELFQHSTTQEFQSCRKWSKIVEIHRTQITLTKTSATF